ncbi:ORF64 [Ranid herpesvirus 2]|uniref:ORF64 n=1 Tax=Ranid herpesvirus 2 TaxID=389214 RepID=Q14W42_9VIRU|nr:ORF64 [Ranid herpesvirus 2]ABG25625.1 ORF64 [Ranid herpesvirus 2]
MFIYYLMVAGLTHMQIFEGTLYGMYELTCNRNSYLVQKLERLSLTDTLQTGFKPDITCKPPLPKPLLLCNAIFDSYVNSELSCMPSYIFRLMAGMCDPEVLAAKLAKISPTVEVDKLLKLLETEPPYIISQALLQASVCKRVDGIADEIARCRKDVTTDYCLNPMALQAYLVEENLCHVHLEHILSYFNVLISARNLHDLMMRDESIFKYITAYTYCDEVPQEATQAGDPLLEQRGTAVIYDPVLLHVSKDEPEAPKEEVCVPYYRYNEL